MLIFWSDAHLEEAQREPFHWGKDVEPSDEAVRRALDDRRELREHARWRGLAFLLFVAPLLASVIASVALSLLRSALA